MWLYLSSLPELPSGPSFVYALLHVCLVAKEIFWAGPSDHHPPGKDRAHQTPLSATSGYNLQESALGPCPNGPALAAFRSSDRHASISWRYRAGSHSSTSTAACSSHNLTCGPVRCQIWFFWQPEDVRCAVRALGGATLRRNPRASDVRDIEISTDPTCCAYAYITPYRLRTAKQGGNAYMPAVGFQRET